MTDPLAEIRERLEASTSGPWAVTVREQSLIVELLGDGNAPDENDASIIVHARYDLDTLVSEVERLRDLEAAVDIRLRGIEDKPHLPYWSGVAAAYADVRKLIRDPDWLAAGLHRPDLPHSPR